MNFRPVPFYDELSVNFLALPSSARCPQPVLSVLSSPSALEAEEVIEQALQNIVQEELGGLFWLPLDALPCNIKLVVSLSSSSGGPSALWRQVEATFERDTVMVLTCDERIAALLRKQGYTVSARGKPHAVVTSGVDIWTDQHDEIALLGALHGANVSVWCAGKEPKLLTKTAAIHWVRSNLSWKCPFTGHAISISRAVQIVSDAKRAIQRTHDVSVCVGMAWWKKARMREFFSIGRRAPAFRKSAKGALRVVERRSGIIAAWTSRIPRHLE